MSSRIGHMIEVLQGVTSLASSVEFWKYMLLSRPEKVRRLAIYMVAIATLFGGTGFYVIVVNPKLLLRVIVWMHRRQCGFKIKQIASSRGVRFNYAERGIRKSGQPSLVLVPGLGGTIENWVPVVKAMKNISLHIVAVEMPGSGDSPCDPTRDLTIMAQVDRLHLFLELTRLAERPIHLVGAATGGTVAGCYAAAHRDGIAKLTLICPAIRSPIDSDLIRFKKEGRDVSLIPRSVDEFPAMMQLLSSKTKRLSKLMMRGIYDLKIKPTKKYSIQLMDSMYEEIWAGEADTLLLPRLAEIMAPTQVIWGRFDRIIHVSGADLVKEKLANCADFHILNCGHSLYLDEPVSLARLIEKFTTAASIQSLK